MAVVEPLSQERDTFAKAKLRLIAESEGKFVLVHADQICGVWDTYEGAIEAGYAAYEPGSFMVKKIERQDKVHYLRSSTCP
jgi:hypothetical protein